MANQFPGTGLNDPPQEETGDPEINLAKKAKDTGHTAKQYIAARSQAIRLTGKTLKWKSHDYDLAFDALAKIVLEVWGPIQ